MAKPWRPALRVYLTGELCFVAGAATLGAERLPGRQGRLATAFLVGGAALAERYCAAHPRTMALVTEEAAPDQLRVFGAHDGVTIERGAGHATAFPPPYVGEDRRGGQ